jgi:hypothetical protein
MTLPGVAEGGGSILSAAKVFAEGVIRVKRSINKTVFIDSNCSILLFIQNLLKF